MEVGTNKHLLKVFDDVISMIYGVWPTPLVKFKSLSSDGYEVWGKLEFFNVLSHSIKDRPVWYMILKALEEGKLGSKLYEASSGNVAIALTLLGNILKVKTRVYIPKPTPKTTESLLKILGAEVVRTEFKTIDREFIEFVKEEARRDGATNLNQFENDYNPEAHFKYTANEIDLQLTAIRKSPPKAIVCGVGTSGHIAAISKYFKSRYGDEVVIVGAIPSKGSVIPGIKRPETGPKWLSNAKVDHVVEVSTEEAIKEVINIARNEGLLIGISSGAVINAFKKVKDVVGKGTYVLVLPDDIFKYIEFIVKYLNHRIENI